MANSDTILYTLRESGSYTAVASNSSYGSDYDSDSSAAVAVDAAGSVPSTDLTGTSWRFFEVEHLTLYDCEFAVNFTSNGVEYIGIKSTDGELYYRDINGEYIKVLGRPEPVVMMYRVRLKTSIEGTSDEMEVDPDYNGEATSHSGHSGGSGN